MLLSLSGVNLRHSLCLPFTVEFMSLSWSRDACLKKVSTIDARVVSHNWHFPQKDEHSLSHCELQTSWWCILLSTIIHNSDCKDSRLLSPIVFNNKDYIIIYSQLKAKKPRYLSCNSKSLVMQIMFLSRGFSPSRVLGTKRAHKLHQSTARPQLWQSVIGYVRLCFCHVVHHLVFCLFLFHIRKRARNLPKHLHGQYQAFRFILSSGRGGTLEKLGGVCGSLRTQTYFRLSLVSGNTSAFAG